MSELAVRWTFTSREDGSSEPPFAFRNLASHVGDDPAAVARNRASVCAEIGAASLVTMRPNHSNSVAIVTSAEEEIVDVDAIITTEHGVGLLAQGADCAPIVIADLTAGIVAAVHCGWRGVVAGVVPATLERIASLGGTPSWARIGPTICPRCYPVGVAVCEQFAAVGGVVSTSFQGEPSVDIRGSVLRQFADAGVPAFEHGGCSFEDRNQFSYRRDGVTGRHGAAIVLGGADERS